MLPMHLGRTRTWMYSTDYETYSDVVVKVRYYNTVHELKLYYMRKHGNSKALWIQLPWSRRVVGISSEYLAPNVPSSTRRPTPWQGTPLLQQSRLSSTMLKNTIRLHVVLFHVVLIQGYFTHFTWQEATHSPHTWAHLPSLTAFSRLTSCMT